MVGTFFRARRLAGAAIVKETFAKTYFNREDPVGRAFACSEDQGIHRLFRIVGLVRDAR